MSYFGLYVHLSDYYGGLSNTQGNAAIPVAAYYWALYGRTVVTI